MDALNVLVVNPGSSTLKLSIVSGDGSVTFKHDAAVDDGELDSDRLLAALRRGREFDAVGVRVVHGGAVRLSAVVDGALLGALTAAASLAPLHNPPALEAIRLLSAERPDVPIVACLDSGFHATLPDDAALYAVPWEWIETWGIRRLGFHGFSHSYAARRAQDLHPPVSDALRVVTCHLGAGASLAAVRGGRSVDTTMGFTPLDGLVMATRSGSVDPGALLWLERHAGLTSRDVERGLDRVGGLLGLSGVSAYMAEVLAAARDGHDRARLAVDVYLHRLRAGIAAMTAALGGIDALVFTGGVGEGSHEIRAGAAEGLGFLGVGIDAAANAAVSSGDDADVTAPGATVVSLVVHAREELTIADDVRRVLTAT